MQAIAYASPNVGLEVGKVMVWVFAATAALLTGLHGTHMASKYKYINFLNLFITQGFFHKQVQQKHNDASTR